MKSRPLVQISATALLFALSQGCGGDSNSSQTATGALDASRVTNASTTFNALEGLLNFVDSSTTAGKLSTRAQASGPSVGDPSLLGCHANSGKNRMLRDIKYFEDPLCKISSAESSDT